MNYINSFLLFFFFSFYTNAQNYSNCDQSQLSLSSIFYGQTENLWKASDGTIYIESKKALYDRNSINNIITFKNVDETLVTIFDHRGQRYFITRTIDGYSIYSKRDRFLKRVRIESSNNIRYASSLVDTVNERNGLYFADNFSIFYATYDNFLKGKNFTTIRQHRQDSYIRNIAISRIGGFIGGSSLIQNIYQNVYRWNNTNSRNFIAPTVIGFTPSYASDVRGAQYFINNNTDLTLSYKPMIVGDRSRSKVFTTEINRFGIEYDGYLISTSFSNNSLFNKGVGVSSEGHLVRFNGGSVECIYRSGLTGTIKKVLVTREAGFGSLEIYAMNDQNMLLKYYLYFN